MLAGPARANGDAPAVIDYGRVVPLSGVERFDGTPFSPPASPARFRQIVYELEKAAGGIPAWPGAEQLRRDGRDPATIPLAIVNARYTLEGRERRAFAVTALRSYTYRGERVVFSFAGRHYLSNDSRAVTRIDVDFDDGLGWNRVPRDGTVAVFYDGGGTKLVRVRLGLDDGEVLQGAFRFEVRALVTPVPDDTISVAATIPYNAQYGSGEAYVYLADGHTAITNPVVVLEGFDIDNSMNWDELYALLNDENLIETLRDCGYDAVVFNFDDSTDPIQVNAFAAVELLGAVQSMLLPQQRFALVGASMGGLVARYALAYMETNAIPHQVATYISFDTPHKGANVPLGIQYWLVFFESESADAAFLLGQLNSPAARQMLVYHYTDPPQGTPSADPLRATFESELSALGGYPSLPRKVAVSNGSGGMQDQGFSAGDQIIDYNYSVPLLTTIAGNVWAVPDNASTRIFEGVFYVLFVDNRSQDVTVSGTLPYDNAPGGWRASMAQMDSTEAPFGDIVALHANHCFIPTISALDLATADPFYDVAGDPALLDLTSFDEVYFPANNQPHVDVTPENAVWLTGEIKDTPSAVPTIIARSVSLSQNYPNPFNPSTTIRFALSGPVHVRLSIFDALGRRVALVIDRVVPEGVHDAVWDGNADDGTPAATGVYFYRLTTPHSSHTRKMVLLK